MKTLLTILALTAAAIISCGRWETTQVKRLAAVESIIDQRPDSALSMLNTINMDGADDDCRALYSLLMTQALYVNYLPIDSDSLINISINHYQNIGNKRMLARAYYYKGATIYDMGQHEEAMKLLKEAERMALETNDETLLGKIYEKNCTVYYDLGYKEKYLKYAKLFYSISIKQNDTLSIGASLNSIAAAYYKLELRDSAFIYLKKSLNYIKKIMPGQKQSYMQTSEICTYIAATSIQQKYILKNP